jgi:hypothetical protein
MRAFSATGLSDLPPLKIGKAFGPLKTGAAIKNPANPSSNRRLWGIELFPNRSG